MGSGGGDGASTSNNLVGTQTSAGASTATVTLISGGGGSALTGAFGGGGLGGGGLGGGAGGVTPGGTGGVGPQSLIDDNQMAGLVAGQTTLFDLRELKRQQGGSAGSKPMNVGAWLRGAYTGIESTDRGGEFDGNAINLVGGVDYLFQNTKIPVVVGLSGGYEVLDIETKFNTGTYEGNGFTFAPYVAISPMRNFIIDASGGMTWLDYDVSRTVGGSKRTGTFDATRYFLAANATYNHYAGAWRLSPTVGILNMREEQDGYTENNGTVVQGNAIDLTRASGGLEVGYNLGGMNQTLTGIEPFVKLVGEWDIDHEKSVDLGNGVKSSAEDFGAVAGGGVNLNLGQSVSGALEGTYNTIGRGNLETWTVGGRVRVKF
ncbi:MAG: autotransporter outer membrane beta-barrel domain-containing protein [Alphaproteobacteria bacterium]